jgi:hypothetical protein
MNQVRIQDCSYHRITMLLSKIQPILPDALGAKINPNPREKSSETAPCLATKAAGLAT